MDIKKVYNLLKMEEGTKLDFKLQLELHSDSGKRELAKDVSAIANSKGGRGYIIVGIEDGSKRIAGVEDENLLKEEQIQQIVSSRCEPPIPIKVEKFFMQGKTVIVITIFDGEQKPYQLRESGAFYIRRGSITDVMRKEELLRAFSSNLDISMETCPVYRGKIEFLNMSLIYKYFEKKGIYINKDNEDFLLESAGIIYKDKESGERYCTYGGLLVFSENNFLKIPYNIIKIVNKVKEDIEEVTIVQGSLITMVNKAKELISSILDGDYPIEGIAEAINNAVLYRDYLMSNKYIEVVLTKKTVVVTSPGELIIKSLKGNNEEYNKRNMWIYEKLMTIDDKGIFLNNGRGFSRMKKAFKGYGKVLFINSAKGEEFKVIFPGLKN